MSSYSWVVQISIRIITYNMNYLLPTAGIFNIYTRNTTVDIPLYNRLDDSLSDIESEGVEASV